MSDGLQVAPPDEARRIRVGLAWALLGVVLFSFSLPLTKVAIGGFSPYQTAMGRAVIAGMVPFLSFVAEHKVSGWVRAETAVAEATPSS